jgi:hypothetical protein
MQFLPSANKGDIEGSSPAANPKYYVRADLSGCSFNQHLISVSLNLYFMADTFHHSDFAHAFTNIIFQVKQVDVAGASPAPRNV